MAANRIYLQVDLSSDSAQQNVNALNKAIDNTGKVAEKSSQQATTSLNKISIGVKSTTDSFNEFAGALAGLGIEKMASSLVKLASEFGDIQASLEAFTGSAEEARRILEDVKGVADRGIFHYDDLLKSARSMKAFGMETKNIGPYLDALQNKMRAIGGSMEDLNDVVGIFGRVMEKDGSGMMELLKKLPGQMVPVMAALKKQMADEMKVPITTISSDDVKRAITNDLLPQAKTINTIMLAIDASSKKIGENALGGAEAFKRLGDNLKELATRIGTAFDPAVVRMAQHLQQLLVPLGKAVDWLEGLSTGTKETILWLAAAATGIIAMASAFKLLFSVLGPGYELLKSTFLLIEGFIAINPELVIAIGLIAGAFYLLYKTVPEVQKFTDSTVDNITKKFKGMFETVKQGAKEIPKIGVDNSPGMQEGAEIWKKQQEVMTQIQEDAAARLLETYSSPMEALTLKYAALFRELDKQIHEGHLTPEHQAMARSALAAAQQTDTFAERVKERKREVDDYVSYYTEKVKGATDAQVAYIEAQDAQSMRGRVAAIDQITQLRIEGERQVAAVQKEALDAGFRDYEAFMRDARNEGYFKSLGITRDQLDQSIATREAETEKKKALIDQKQFDETQKYRLDGWKKANDVIIEEQKRVYDSFRDMWGEFFDAMTGKAGSVGKAIGDMFKKLAINEVKETFANQMAGLSTQMAGYGTPQESIPGHGSGLLGILLRRGMPPRPQTMDAPHGVDVPGLGVQNVQFGGQEGMTAVTPFIEKVDMFAIATTGFAKAVDQFTVTINQQNAQTSGAIAASLAPSQGVPRSQGVQVPYESMFQGAAAQYGVDPATIKAIVKQESNFNPNAVNPKSGATGLGQFMPGTARDMGITDPTDPAQAIYGTAKYIGQLKRQFGSDEKAFAAYNFGPGNVAKGRPWPAETRDYVQKVTGYQQMYRGGGGEQVTSTFMPTAAPAMVNPAQMAGLPAGGSTAVAVSTTAAAAAPMMQQTGIMQMMGFPQPATMMPVNHEQLAGLPVSGSSTSQLFPSIMREPESVTAGAMPQLMVSALGTGDVKKAQGLMAAMVATTTRPGGGGVAGVVGGLAGLKDMFGIHPAIPASATGSVLQQAGMPSLPGMAGTTSAGSILTSRGAGALYMAGGMATLNLGLQKRNTGVTALGGAGAGLGMLLQNPKLFTSIAGKLGGGAGGAAGAAGTGIAAGAGLGLVMAGLQKGGMAGFGIDIAGGALAGAAIGTMVLPGLGTAIGAGIGAAAGALAGGIRLLIKTEPEKIRIQIKQVYGIDISNLQIIKQIQQIIDQNYGGNVAVGIRSQQVQDIVRLYALSTGQAAGLPRPEYNATIAQSAAGGNQLQQVYQGGQLVQNPYSGPTTYQYQQAVTAANGLQGVPGATGLVNQGFSNLVVASIQSNPAAVANASAAAARAGDSRMTTTAAMLEPLTALS